jgi:hypothetical protein
MHVLLRLLLLVMLLLMPLCPAAVPKSQLHTCCTLAANLLHLTSSQPYMLKRWTIAASRGQQQQQSRVS